MLHEPRGPSNGQYHGISQSSQYANVHYESTREEVQCDVVILKVFDPVHIDHLIELVFHGTQLWKH